MKESMMPSEDGVEKVTGCARINPGRAAVAFVQQVHSRRVQPYYPILQGTSSML